ncbi:I66 family serine proteinase inhibitor [Nostoc sp. 'Peltigera membranacea cyanobiont' N6]|uniref:I66 family serine proteinase inhibitor n=1 Tax=Nostoc sp. 'Peltigera membranacea cyanobiont' N6 TaxID=1261031 RepID=UPI000CF30C53|nr:I66 family serine proteinase inhibitor [Nostoc sp. 'Peltigera membranacea cyanobiont' N6]AVH66544.1 hypothetical protein NPM_5087 [Nostoc sp. 'Peltigera membranacea cyanobiont' N6]
MPTLNGSYILKAEGAPTGVIDGKVYALLFEEQQSPEKWAITPVPASNEGVVTIQTSDRSKAWTVSSDQEQEQITVEGLNSNSPAPNQVFRIVWPEPDENRLIQLLTNSSSYGIGRNRIEDRSLLPKRIVSRPDGTEIPVWVCEALR